MKRSIVNRFARASAATLQRRVFDGPRAPLPRHQHRQRAGFDREHQHRAARRHQAQRAQERGQGHRLREQRADQRRDDLSIRQPHQLGGLGADEQHDEQHAARDRYRQQRVEDGVGDELDEHDGPVGRGDESAPLQ